MLKEYKVRSSAVRAVKAEFGDAWAESCGIIANPNGTFSYDMLTKAEMALPVQPEIGNAQLLSEIETIKLLNQSDVDQANIAAKKAEIESRKPIHIPMAPVTKPVTPPMAPTPNPSLPAFLKIAPPAESNVPNKPAWNLGGDDLALDIVAQAVAADKLANAEAIEAGKKLTAMNLTHSDKCPGCDIGLDNGICDYDHLVEVQGKHARDMQQREYACMACGFEWGPVRVHGSKVVLRQSTAPLPTKLVWHVADEMVGAKRKDVIEECVKRGIAYGTARTQYQHWFKTKNDSAATPIATIGKDGKITYPGK